jgi:hypothetical protein
MKTQNEMTSYMKRTSCTIICLTALALNSALSQPPPAPMSGPGPVQAPAPSPSSSTFSERLQNIIKQASEPGPAPVLTKFNLDFPGGPPKELVAAIEKASGRPLNAIVPDEFADTRLPALKMNSINVAQLFQALEAASRQSEAYQPQGFGNYQVHQTAYGFKTEGQPSDDSIWHFYVEKPVLPPAPAPYQSPKICRFYSLAPYVDRGLSVDDITTAIETGWKMLGDTSPPTISFHKDTKLLIAVGEQTKLEIIDAALKALEPPMTGRRGGGFGGPGSEGVVYTPATPRTNALVPAAK